MGVAKLVIPDGEETNTPHFNNIPLDEEVIIETIGELHPTAAAGHDFSCGPQKLGRSAV